jgi:hypothetical protein
MEVGEQVSGNAIGQLRKAAACEAIAGAFD